MTKSEMAYSDASLFGPAALFLNQYFNCPINENYLLYIVCVSLIYSLSVCILAVNCHYLLVLHFFFFFFHYLEVFKVY